MAYPYKDSNRLCQIVTDWDNKSQAGTELGQAQIQMELGFTLIKVCCIIDDYQLSLHEPNKPVNLFAY